jgi:uncharacterized protein (TIGR03905 family)
MTTRRITHHPTGVCSKVISFTLRNGRVYRARFDGGCHGNTQGISRLVEGMRVAEVKKRLGGIVCGKKGTSCPDQLAVALAELGKASKKR